MAAAATGIGATLVMDLWNLFLARATGIPSLDYCLLGRWILHMPSGTFRHARIGIAATKAFECPVGRIAHYSIGVLLALGLAVSSPGWRNHPAFPLALLYGIGTVVLPFLVMQPSLGLGIASSKAPNPTRARLKSLASHAVFGIGLYLCALGLHHLRETAAP
jgi:hypothetical protein